MEDLRRQKQIRRYRTDSAPADHGSCSLEPGIVPFGKIGARQAPLCGLGNLGTGYLPGVHNVMKTSHCAEPDDASLCGLGNLGTEDRRATRDAVVGQHGAQVVGVQISTATSEASKTQTREGDVSNIHIDNTELPNSMFLLGYINNITNSGKVEVTEIFFTNC